MKKLITKFISIYVNSTATLFPDYNSKLIFKLICHVQRIPISKQAIAFFEEGNTTMLETSHKPVALHKWGNGSKNILFLHGWRSNSKQWLPYVDQLNLEEFTIYALDAPGHGLSEGNHLNLELYRQCIEKSIKYIGDVQTVVSHSLGSLAVSYTYLHNPKINIDSFIITGSPGAMQDILEYAKNLLSLSRKANRNLKKKIDGILHMPIENITLEEFFSKVNKPLLVIHEKSDVVTPLAVIEKALQNKNYIQRLFTNGQDHMLKGEETIESTIQFIKNPLCTLKNSKYAGAI